LATQDRQRSNTIKVYLNSLQIAHRLFVVSSYTPDKEGQLTAQLPDVCPKGIEDPKPCKVFLDHNRDRLTGPCFPLHVVRCRGHNIAFTIYPPGHVPYGREQIVCNVAPDGNLVAEEKDEPLQSFEGTLFDAALDAANHKAWPKESQAGYQDGRFNTQINQIGRAGLLVGIAPGQEAKQREAIAEILDVPYQNVHESATLVKTEPDYKSFGQAICRILQAVPTNNTLFEQFAASGYEVGLWPPLYCWNWQEKKLYLNNFHKMTTRGPP